jgi:hypothetical protein
MSTARTARPAPHRLVIEVEVDPISTATTEEIVEALAALGLTVTSTRLPAAAVDSCPVCGRRQGWDGHAYAACGATR